VKPAQDGFASTTEIGWFSLELYRTPTKWLTCFLHQCDRWWHILLGSRALFLLANRKNDSHFPESTHLWRRRL